MNTNINSILAGGGGETGGSHSAKNGTIIGIGPIAFWHTTSTSSTGLILLLLLSIVTGLRIILSHLPHHLPPLWDRWYMIIPRFFIQIEKYVPESAILVIIGVVIGGTVELSTILIKLWDHEYKGLVDVVGLTFNNEIFFLVLIPPIIFDAGYFIQKNFFFSNLNLILVYALVGTLVNTFATSMTLWLFGLTGIFARGEVSFPSGTHFTLIDLFIFGSLISAVDPVAVIAIFEAVEVNSTLNILVFGESVLNDAVSIVLYNLFLSLKTLEDQAISRGGHFVFGLDHALLAVVKFLYVSLGGLSYGLVCGFLCAFCTRFTQHLPILEPLLIGIWSLSSYFLSESCGMSGIMAILFCGIFMSRYVNLNISKHSHLTIKNGLKMIASSAETLIFVYLGISIITLWKDHVFNLPFILITLVFIFIYRFILTFSLTGFANMFRAKKERISFRNQFILAYGGLRGAIAFALAFGLPDAEHKFTTQKNTFVTTTLLVIISTIFIQGITLNPLLKLLSVKRKEDTNQKMKDLIDEEIQLNFEEHELKKYIEEMKYLQLSTNQLPKGNPERTEFENSNCVKVTRIVKKVKKEIIRMNRQLEELNKDFVIKDQEPEIAEKQNLIAEQIQEEWRSYLDGGDVRGFIKASEDISKSIKYLRDHIYRANDHPKKVSGSDTNREFKEIMKGSKFCDLALELEIITTSNDGFELSDFARNGDYLYFILRLLQEQQIKIWLKKVNYSLECRKYNEMRFLLEVIDYIILQQHKNKEEELELLKRVNFAGHVFTSGFAHVKEGIKAVGGNWSLRYRITQLLRLIDEGIQYLCVRQLHSQERELIDALNNLKSIEHRELELKDLHKAEEEQIYDDLDKIHYHHKLNMSRVLELGKTDVSFFSQPKIINNLQQQLDFLKDQGFDAQEAVDKVHTPARRVNGKHRYVAYDEFGHRQISNFKEKMGTREKKTSTGKSSIDLKSIAKKEKTDRDSQLISPKETENLLSESKKEK